MAHDLLLYQTKAIKALEKRAIQWLSLSETELMERAGQAAWHFLQQQSPTAKHITVFCGSGNNGGDGLVLARLVKMAGIDVHVVFVGHVTELTAAAKAVWQACQEAHVEVITFGPGANLPETDLIVDALLGTGLSRPLQDNFLLAVQTINATHLPILALDVPTGVNADTGVVYTDAVKARWTLTFIAKKIGLTTAAATDYVGELLCDDLAIPSDIFAAIPPAAYMMQDNFYKTILPRRAKDSHKGLFGHVLVIGGNHGMSGAPRMAAIAAERVGAGRVTVVTRPEYAPLVNLTMPELLSLGVEDPVTLDLSNHPPSCIIIGPGLGRDAWAQAMMQYVINLTLPLLIDADGLRWLADHPHRRDNWILTPHPGEAAMLLHSTTQDVQHHRLAAAQALQHKYGGTVVLKGAGSIVCAPDVLPQICVGVGNPGMATAGMGDSLCGVIAGLVAQQVALPAATVAGVWLHAKAGDLAAAAGGERGLVPSDLLPFLRQLVNES
jgi:NAD(P)H-hydrate epimerase